MPHNSHGLRQARRAALFIALAAGPAAPVVLRANPTQEYTGTIALQDIAPSIVGSGFIFGQAEGPTGPNQFEVNPGNVFQNPSIFFYVNAAGASASGYPNAVGSDSSHADFVAGVIYGGTFGGGAPSQPGGIAYGLTSIHSYDANYLINAVNNSISLPDKIINQSFKIGNSDGSNFIAADQEPYDSIYDNYVVNFGTIFVSASGSTGAVTAPGTSYNSISVGMYNGGFLSGPTIDNGRSKPDVAAVANSTSIATAEVSGVTALIYQAAASNLGGAGTSAAATDVRTIKALVMNGASKLGGWSHSPTQPLDPTEGAGVVHAIDSYEILIAGKQPGSSADAVGIGASHPAPAGANTSSLLGWDKTTLTSSSSTDAFRDYAIQPATGLGITGYDLSATLVWNRPISDPNNENISNPINNLYLYLFDATTNTATPIDSSISTVDNVQLLYDLNLTAGHVYDIQVLKHGGTIGSQGVLSNSETYSLAYSFVSDPHQYIWVQPGGGSWTAPQNWANDGVPDFAGAAVTLGAAISGPFNVNLDGNHTLGQLVFNSTNSYTLSTGAPSTSTLIMDWGANNALILDFNGSHAINTPVQLNSNTLVSIAGSGNTLTMNGAISGAGSLTEMGNGTLVLAAANSYSGPTTINSGTMTIAAAGALPSGGAVTNDGQLNVNAASVTGTLQGSGTTSIGSTGSLQIAPASAPGSQGALTISSGGLLDLTNSSLTLNYGSNSSPNATIRDYLSNAYHGATIWTGTTGITSTLAAGDPQHHSVAFADGADGVVTHLPAGVSSAIPAGGTLPAGSELVTYALAADANLDGKVDFADFIVLSNHFGTSDINWDHGNFNYDGIVDFADFIVLSNNFGEGTGGGGGIGATPQELAQYNALAKSFGISQSQIAAWDATISNLPEPASAGLFSIPATALLARRRKIRKSSSMTLNTLTSS